MAFENLFIRTKKSIGGIELDAVINETHTSEVEVTSNPVELGADITDHSIIKPKRIQITAQVSDTPLGLAALGQIVDNVTGLFGSSTSENITRSTAAYSAIIQLQESREPIDIQTKLKLYSNMIITNVSVTQDKDTSRIVLMNISAQEVRIVKTKVVKLEASDLSGSAKIQASSAEVKGKVETVIPDDTTNRSVLKSISGWTL